MREQTMDQERRKEEILAGLRRIRRRHRTTWILLLAFPLLALMPRSLFGVGVLAIFFGLMAAAILSGTARCPRCGRYFFIGRWGYHKGFSSECINCRLRLDGSNVLDYDLDNSPRWPARAPIWAKALVTAVAACGVYAFFAAELLPQWRRYHELETDGVRTIGRVTAKIPSSHRSVHYLYAFPADGREISGSGLAGQGQIEVGQAIVVTYLPRAPDISLPGRPSQLYHEWTWLMFVILPAISLLGGWSLGPMIADLAAGACDRILAWRQRSDVVA